MQTEAENPPLPFAIGDLVLVPLPREDQPKPLVFEAYTPGWNYAVLLDEATGAKYYLTANFDTWTLVRSASETAATPEAALKEASLDGANLCGASLDGANLSGADLSRANAPVITPEPVAAEAVDDAVFTPEEFARFRMAVLTAPGGIKPEYVTPFKLEPAPQAVEPVEAEAVEPEPEPAPEPAPSMSPADKGERLKELLARWKKYASMKDDLTLRAVRPVKVSVIGADSEIAAGTILHRCQFHNTIAFVIVDFGDDDECVAKSVQFDIDQFARLELVSDAAPQANEAPR